MQYMFIIHNDNTAPQPGQPGFAEFIEGYTAFSEELKRLGISYIGDPLQPPSTATTVRVRNGKTITSDGPFAETKEWMSGFYKFECKDLDQALQLAAKIPSARHGSVEVRPIRDMTKMHQETQAELQRKA